MSDEDSADAAPVRDAAAWRSLVVGLPARELLKRVQADKAVSRYILAGFRAAPDALRNPAVLTRIAECAHRNPAFAALVEELLAPTVDEPAPAAVPRPPTPKVPDEAPPREDPKVKDKLKELRATIREKDARLAELEAQLVALTRERDAVRADADADKKARAAAEALAERERRQRERDARRSSPRATETSAPRSDTEAPRPENLSAGQERRVTPALEEAMRRLINRGKYAVVAEVCREFQAGETALDAADRGAIHTLTASALYGQGQDAAGEEQDRLAASAFLDAGQVAPAAAAVARALAHSVSTAPRAVEIGLLQRLLVLAGRTGEVEAVQSTLVRLRVTAPAGYQRLRKALQGAGKKNAALLSLAPAEASVRIAADEVIALPTPGKTASRVTARQLAEAVETGDENFVTCARDGIETLRQNDSARADALLEAVAALAPAAVHPLIQPLVRPVVVDASNVARYNNDPLARLVDGGAVAVGNLTAMRDYLLRRGYFPVLLIADANLRFLVDDRAAFLALVERGVVRETLPGVPADGMLISEARERVAPLVTNDRLTEWGDVARRVERIAFDVFPGGAIALTPV